MDNLTFFFYSYHAEDIIRIIYIIGTLVQNDEIEID